MNLLALESSCDETACAVVTADAQSELWVRSSIISSQIDIHRQFGGVVPEVAARHHIQNILPVVEEALNQAKMTLNDIDGVAVTQGPGLIGALLVGVQVAKAIAYAKNIPLVGVHHLEGHMMAVFLRDEQLHFEKKPSFPHIGVLVSGGHTSLVWVRNPCDYEMIGSTRDDAAGEAFDKIGKMLGLGYPAGPHIDRLAETGNARSLVIPQAMRDKKFDFSYSGLKTFVAQTLQRQGMPGTAQELADVCAAVQGAIVEQIVRKTGFALDAHPATGVVLSGGVACNRALRMELQALCTARNVPFFVPPARYCTDNAAMIAAAGYYRLQKGQPADLRMNAQANLPLLGNVT